MSLGPAARREWASQKLVGASPPQAERDSPAQLYPRLQNSSASCCLLCHHRIQLCLGTVVRALGKLRRGIVRPPIWTFRRRTLCGIGRRCEGPDSAGFPVERGHVAADLEAIRTRAFRAEAEAHRAVARSVADERLIPDDEPCFRLLRRVGPEREHEIDNAEKLGASRIVCCRN